MTIALVRAVSRAMDRCELTHRDRVRIDPALAARQHDAYVDILESLGCTIVTLREEPDLPDSVFVEDVAVVFSELAVLTRPGAQSRRAEGATVAAALEPHRTLIRLDDPGTLDGGDVLVLGRDVYVGTSSRTNTAGIDQMRRAVVPHGYVVHETPVRGCLHLKSAVTRVSDDEVLLNPEQVDPARFAGMHAIAVDPAEPDGSNALYVGGKVVYPSAFPRTAEILESRGISVVPVDVSEVQKAEGGVTCCSIVF